jgi:PilZ domain
MAHKRRYSRLPFPTDSTVTLGPGGAPLVPVPAELIDISLKGALVQRPPELDAEVGMAMVLDVHLQDSPVHITMKGTVAHLTEERIGMHCLSIDMDSMIHLRRLMELNLGDPRLLERELLALG